MPLVDYKGDIVTSPCPICKDALGHHNFDCSNVTIDYLRYIAKEQARIIQSQNKPAITHDIIRQRSTDRFKKEIERWQGKFQLIKTENNALRKANQKLLNQITELERVLSGAGMVIDDDAERFLECMQHQPSTDPEKARQAKEYYKLFKQIYKE